MCEVTTELYERYNPVMVGVAQRVTGCYYMAEDAAHDVWLSLLVRQKDILDEQAYLCQAARLRALKIKKRYEREVPMEVTGECGTGTGQAV